VLLKNIMPKNTFFALQNLIYEEKKEHLASKRVPEG